MPHRRASDNASFQIKRPFIRGTTWMPRLLQEPSPKARRRLEVLDWHAAHGAVMRLTARHFGYSPDTISRWARAFREHRLLDLEDRSRRPKKVRTPTTPSRVVIRIRELREQYPRWGREDLPSAIGELEQRLAAWNHIYEEVRPHQALGYLTPNAFYAQWLFAQQTRVSDIP